MAALDKYQQSPLHDQHLALGAKFAPFGGWEMPVAYAGGGVLAEHAAVRSALGVFDVSHLGTVRVRGAGATEFLNASFTNDLGRIADGQAQYTLCCDAETGGVIDDLIVYRFSDEHLLCIPNAANSAAVTARLTAAAPERLSIVDEHGAHAIIAVQGPRSAQLLALLGLPYEQSYMHFATATWRDEVGGDPAHLVVCRTGYTGERGYEIIISAEAVHQLWGAALQASEGWGARPCGLGARDTLRTEMGYPLHGHELTPQITPVQARLEWAVGWRKPRFWGRDALFAERERGPARRATGVLATERGVPRAGMRLYRPGGDQPVGELTSGTFSPTRQVGIGLALMATAADLTDGDEVEIDARGRRIAARLTAPPFVAPAVR